MELSATKFDDSDQEDDDVPEENHITWSDLFFLPFHPVFKLIVLMSVIVKCMLGPIQAVYPIIHCSDVIDKNLYLSVMKYFYTYFSDVIYFLDTFLHIIHRQVTETTMKREYLPKSAFLLLIDVISLIPFYALMTYENCALAELWPNILAFTEFIVIYRVVQYFSMVSTHSYCKLATGFIFMLLLCVNCICCFLILLTINGLCENCKHNIYDWRKYINYQKNVTDEQFTTYVYGTLYIMALITNDDKIVIKPSTVLEYLLVSVFLVCFYLLYAQVLVPKLFSESTLVNKSMFEFYRRCKKIIDETKRRNPSPLAHIHVTNFYTLMWKKRKGIINLPNIVTELPQSLRVDIKHDLVWPLFYHSPTLRKTTTSLKRYLSEFVNLNYKLPGEKFYTGLHCHSNMFYLKSGIIQLISSDDGVTPLLSLTSGTILGDVNFIVPSKTKHFNLRCLTYCEVLTLSRYDILQSLKKYPVDRRNVIKLVREKLKHARTLYTCKQHVRGLDRTEDEGIAWLKRRWWEISGAVASWKKKCDDDEIKCELPPEEAVYHCAKYIGQLVLCSDVQLHTKTLFANVKFPWILSSETSFLRIWHIIVAITVFMVLIAYPPNLVRTEMSSWFKLFRYWTDFVYIADIFISILTTNSVVENFTTVILTRCKRPQFVLDVLATIWLEYIALLLRRADLFNFCQVNRLIKIYLLFTNDYANEWNIRNDPIFYILYKIVLMKFCLAYITYYVGFMILLLFLKILTIYFFLEPIDEGENIFLGISIAYLKFQPHRLIYYCFEIMNDFGHYLMVLVFECIFISCLCLRGREQANYQTFVTNLKNYYKHHRIHQDLMKRLDKYLLCQWKYYRGMDIMHPILLKEEAFDIFWKVQCEVAENIISKSKAFIGADPSLVRELASSAKFLIMPKHTTLLLFGIQSKTVSWIVQGHIKCEYHNEEGELLNTILNPGQMVSVSTVLLKRPSLKTYSCNTECELIYIKLEDFINIIKRYPNEASHFQNCIEEFDPLFENIFQAYVKKHKEVVGKNFLILHMPISYTYA
ncbi:unnamed protein product [Chilo suppressalis]|uniref:Cyclic nucleotide-binding domain-containing protein n=1 Tax=Chilo suppressalis TaxID=168631 RepID=A0ABN8AUU8_CHISP|nr:unnamed protein product [Chilo suppressalis]